MYNIYLSYRVFRRAYNKNKRATLKTLNRVSKLKLNLMKTQRVSIKKARIILKQRDRKARKDFAKLQERMEVWKKTNK